MVTITSNAAEFAARVGKVAPAMDKAAAVATAKCAKVVDARARKHFVPYGKTSGASLSSAGLVRKRSGHLLQSLASSEAKRDGKGWFATVGFRKGVVDSYAKSVEDEQTSFTAKKKLLAIPVNEALTTAGVARYRSPLDVPDGFWRENLAGFVGFYQWVGKRLRLLFVGRRTVKVRGARPLKRSLDGARPQFVGIFQAEEAAAIRNALGGRG